MTTDSVTAMDDNMPQLDGGTFAAFPMEHSPTDPPPVTQASIPVPVEIHRHHKKANDIMVQIAMMFVFFILSDLWNGAKR